ncbi:DUF4239 domain-containing protein [Rhizohabitans arisaemae]|uniref:bestrophin-like domain n=1 Tax=Rhizohabitans arisaemae TaxID=2720610 RepID=UPI0024B1D1E1|nr:DUF4239 domain-containing protein [Rhizohabitans arisaemae]
MDESRGEGNLDFALNLALAVYLLILAYGVVLGRDGIEAARQDVATEAESLVELYWAVAPLQNNAEIKNEIRSYTTQSIQQDWPLMQGGQVSEEAGNTLESFRANLLRLRPANEADESLRQDALVRASEVSHARQLRASNTGGTIPDVFMTCMVISGIAVIAFPWLLGYRPNLASVVGDTTRVAVVLVGLVVLAVVSNPFSGAAAVDSEPFELAREQFNAIDQRFSGA